MKLLTIGACCLLALPGVAVAGVAQDPQNGWFNIDFGGRECTPSPYASPAAIIKDARDLHAEITVDDVKDWTGRVVETTIHELDSINGVPITIRMFRGRERCEKIISAAAAARRVDDTATDNEYK